jgi:hypothetical protein
MERVLIPADIDQPDRILAGLTARQLLILTPAALPAGVLFLLARPLLPLPVATGWQRRRCWSGWRWPWAARDGISLDRLAVAALRQHLAPRRLVPAPRVSPRRRRGTRPPPPASRPSPRCACPRLGSPLTVSWTSATRAPRYCARRRPSTSRSGPQTSSAP